MGSALVLHGEQVVSLVYKVCLSVWNEPRPVGSASARCVSVRLACAAERPADV